MNIDEVRALHNRILGIAESGISAFEQVDVLDERMIKSLEVFDKIIRAAIELKQKDAPVSAESLMSVEELWKGFE